ncbi:MAG: ADP-ribosylation factor-like protein [Candidatus Helarchaeota archaeon]
MPELIEKKIILIGLDNAGKTTILTTMKKEQGSHAYDLKPTKGVNIEELRTAEAFSTDELSIIIWDFGGQERYRKDYLRESEKYFSEIDSAIYVIDIQDKKRFDESIEYLKSILELIKKYNEGKKVDFMIFLHKLDPHLVNEEEYQNRSKNLKELVKKSFEHYDFGLKIFETSIYTVFEKIEVI